MKKETSKDFLKRLAGFSAGPIVSAILGFIMVPITTYFVDPTELGKSAMYTLGFTLSSLVVYLGFDQAFVREYNSQEDKQSLLWNSFIVPFGFSILLAIIYIIFRNPVSVLMFDEVEGYIMILLAVSLPFAALDRFNMLVIRMQEKARLYSFLTIINKLIGLLVLIFYMVFIDASFKGIINATFVNLVLIAIIGLIINRSFWSTKIKLNPKLIKFLMKYGLPLVPTSIIIWVFSSMDKIALRSLSTFYEIGLYTAAFKIVNVLGIIQQAFSTFWTPTSFRWYESKVEEEKFLKVSRMLSALMTVIFIGLLLCKDIIIKLLSSDYADAAVVVPFLMFYPLMYTISETTNVGIAFSRKTSYNIIISLVSALVNYVGNYILVPIYGALGASISTGISYMVFFWMRTLISRRLWYKFPIGYYLVNSLLLLLLAFSNVFIDSLLPTLLFSVLLLIANRRNLADILKIFLDLIKKKEREI